ncbi:MAG: hypothetical protein PHH68_03090 [Candidatus Omnitrophica bacterium]|jgi:hypothetical protein|nr:hypothetical protein [Candidatus Omnitrophota bacterium]
MFKRPFYIAVITTGFCLGLCCYLKAQRPVQEEPSDMPDLIEGVNQIEIKLGSLSQDVANANREISNKLDQVLDNQDKIFKELEIVKVRASRKH